MGDPVTSRSLVRRIAGVPEVACRLASDPPLVVEWYRVLLETASIPPLPAPVLLVHTGGKPISYRSRRSEAHGVSVPGLVTLVPRLMRGEIALGGVGEGAVVYFENARRIPAWVTRLAPLEPVTAVDELASAIVQQVIVTARAGPGHEQYLATLYSRWRSRLKSNGLAGLSPALVLSGARANTPSPSLPPPDE